jgi:hypothetical protein
MNMAKSDWALGGRYRACLVVRAAIGRRRESAIGLD